MGACSKACKLHQKRTLFSVLLWGILFSLPAIAQPEISFQTDDGGIVFADHWGIGDNAIVLVHGGQFNQESWAPQAKTLVGYQVASRSFPQQKSHSL